MDMASRIEDGMELDATYGSEGRPELRKRWNWTPHLDVTGVQNGESQKNGRQQENAVASRIEDGMELDAMYGKGRRPKLGRSKERTPAGERRGVQGEIGENLDAALW